MTRKYMAPPMRTIHLTLSPAEALIIDYSLKNGENSYEHHQEFLIKIMSCIITNKPRNIEVNEDTLWLLRNKIDHQMNIGSVTGGAVLVKVYKAILALRPILFTKELIAPIEPGQESTALIIREEDGEEY